MSTNRRILCVDDESNILDAFRRNLRKDFSVWVAEGGEQALQLIRTQEPFAAILSDMRMPGMNGIELLARVKAIAPNTVRLMLTGNSDQQTAVDAVNQGSIFRFLTKPCPPELLTNTLEAAVEQYRLVSAEKELLEGTLDGSLHVLLDVLAIVNPTAFNRSGRVKRLARELAEGIGVERVWEVEFAAMLSQIGCVAVPEEVLQKIAHGSPLSHREAELYNNHPKTGRELIAKIPRLETVAAIVEGQNTRFDEMLSGTRGPAAVGASVLKAALDHDRLVAQGFTPREAFAAMEARTGWYAPKVLAALAQFAAHSTEAPRNVELPVNELKPGMYMVSPLVSLRGSTLLPAGQEITPSLILRIKNLVTAGMVDGKVTVATAENAHQPPPAAFESRMAPTF
jgi:response regulator RpfG family c-di-GMP phosphodiesterase